MKQLLFAAALLFCITANAQSDLPLSIEDPKMDMYLQNRQPAVLTIQVNNAPDSIKNINVECVFVSFGSNIQTKKYYRTDADGFVEIILDENLPYQQVWLSVGNYLYADAYINTDLKVTIDVAQIKNKDEIYFTGEGIAYSGVDGELNTVMNNYMSYKNDERSELANSLSQLPSIKRSYTTDLFLKKADSIWQALNRIDNEFIKQYPKYDWAINNETTSKFYGWMCWSYVTDTMPKNLFEKINNHKPYFTSNDGILFNRHLSVYLSRKTVNMTNYIRIIDSSYSQPKADILKMPLLERRKNSFAESYPEILNSLKTMWCKKLVTTEFDDAIHKQKEVDSLLASDKQINDTDNFIGTPIEQLPFDANLYRLDSIKNINEFILNLKSKFKNKALLIDFWATWCAPCLQEMPFSKKLHEANKDLPIEYIYICTNSSSNINIWKNKIAGLQLPGTHIFMDERIVEELKSEFNNAGSGYPTYVVVDINGELRPKAIQWMQYLDRDKLKDLIGL